MNRRGFLGSVLAACAAPAIVKAGVLMPVKKIIVPEIIVPEIGRYEGVRFITAPTLVAPLDKITIYRRPLPYAGLGQRHYIGGSCWISEVVLNEAWMKSLRGK